VSLKGEDALSLEGVPNIAVEVIVSCEQVAAADGESNGSNTAEDVVVRVLHKLAVGTDIKQAARRIIGPASKGHSVGEVLHCVDIGLMSLKGLHALASSEVPQLGGGIASTRDEAVLVRRNGNTHDIAVVVRELGNFRTGFNIPQDASHVTRTGNDLAIVEETAAGKVTRVGVKFAAHTDGRIPTPEVVDGADVIKTTAGNEASGR